MAESSTGPRKNEEGGVGNSHPTCAKLQKPQKQNSALAVGKTEASPQTKWCLPPKMVAAPTTHHVHAEGNRLSAPWPPTGKEHTPCAATHYCLAIPLGLAGTNLVLTVPLSHNAVGKAHCGPHFKTEAMSKTCFGKARACCDRWGSRAPEELCT